MLSRFFRNVRRPIAIIGSALSALGLLSGVASAHSSPTDSTVAAIERAASSPAALRKARAEDVRAFSPTDAWTVGERFQETVKGRDFTLAEHWDGTAWTQVATPDVGNHDNRLFAVDGVAPDDVWAGGGFDTADLRFRPQMMHWDGSTWVRSPLPVPRLCFDCGIKSLAAFGPDDVWAAGFLFREDGGAEHAFFEHWDGDRWSVVPATQDRGVTDLNAIGGSSGTDVWAVGTRGVYRPLALHYDGTAWSEVPVPRPARAGFTGVYASSPSNALAVGYAHGAGFAEHWDGASWQPVDVDDPDGSTLYDVDGTSARDAWAVGEIPYKSLIVHWDGSDWTRVDSPSPHGDSALYDVSADRRDDAWAVGTNGHNSITLHWDGTAWTSVPFS